MIDIKTFAVKKAAAKTSPYVYYGSSGGGFGNNTSSNVAGKIEGHYLWGQYFDATQDINGDLTSNGKITSQRLKFIDGTGNTLTIQDFTASTASIISISSTTINNEGNIYNKGDITNHGNINNLGKITTDKLEAVSGYIQTLLGVDWTVENLTVTKAAHFFKLIIDEIKATQGAIIVTPANAKIDKVTQSGNNYTCYFRTTDPTTKKQIYNNFEVNDQVVCQTFNAATGTSYNVSNKYYWSLVYETGTTTVDNVSYHYVKLHYSDRDPKSNGVPQAGDEIVLLGNRNDASRQNAIVISAYNSQFLDAGLKAPSIVQYSGINNYNLSSHRLNIISNGLNSFKGAFTTTDGKDVKQSFDSISGDVQTNITNISSLSATCTGLTSTVQSQATSITNLDTKIGTVSGSVETNATNISTLQQTASSLSSTISEQSKSITSVTNSVGNLEKKVTTNTDSISKLQQTATGISASVSANTKTINDMSGQVEKNKTDIANLKVTATGLTSTVQSLSGTVMQSESKIEQTADNIRLEVMNCGVDIDNERIRLNGDTLIEGNLTVQGDGVGFTLAGSGGTTEIISDSIGSWNSFSATSLVRQTKSSYSVTNPTTVGGKYQHTMSQWLYFGWVNNGNTVTFNSFDTSLEPSTYSSANNYFTFYIDGTQIGSASYTGIRNSLVNRSFTATKSGNLQVKRTMTLTTTRSGQYNAFLYLTVTYATNAYSKIAYDGMGFNLGNGHHIFCNGTDGVRIGNPSWEQVYTLDGIETYFPQGRSFNDNGTIRTDIATSDETQKSVKFGQKRVRTITSTGILYLQPHDQILKVSAGVDNSKVYIMLGTPGNRKGWNFTLLSGENVNVVADISGTPNAQKLNPAFIHNFYCDGVFWYYQGGSRTCIFSNSSAHAYG